jgi:hypothetical protein
LLEMLILDASTADLRRSTLRLAAIGAAVGVLLALVFGLRSLDTGKSEPLNPNDAMSSWLVATAEQKRATAELLLAELRRDQKLGPQTQAALADPEQAPGLADQLVAALDRATDRNVKDYVSPGQSIARTAASIATKEGWSE